MGKIKTDKGFLLSIDEFLRFDDEKKNSFICEFVYQSNLIEGIVTDYVQTIVEGEKPKPLPELTEHALGLQYVIDNFSKKAPSEKDIKKMHSLIMSPFLKDAGKYRRCKVWVGRKGGLYYVQVPKLMKSLEGKIADLDSYSSPSPDKIWDIHNEFETIHPFVDGNGRTGRLLLNWLSLRKHGSFYVVQASNRTEYYSEIKSFSREFKKDHPEAKFYKDRPCRQDLSYLKFLNGKK